MAVGVEVSGHDAETVLSGLRAVLREEECPLKGSGGPWILKPITVRRC